MHPRCLLICANVAAALSFSGSAFLHRSLLAGFALRAVPRSVKVMQGALEGAPGYSGAHDMQSPNWLVVVDGSSRKDVGGTGAYLLGSYSEAKAVVLKARQVYERLLPEPGEDDKELKLQQAENAARDILKEWANAHIVCIPPERAAESAFTGSTDMEVKAAVAAFEDLLRSTQAPGTVILATDSSRLRKCADASKGGKPSSKDHLLRLEQYIAQLEKVGGRLTIKKIDSHGPTKKRMEDCSFEDGNLQGDWEGLVFFPVDMAARKFLRSLL
eukprot:gnl/TRDRNA2_/TRDRNA2_157584_c0_seq1.p1 gnl/TRDRNA2_/TRDRNA2_157584_c0~~gnl/TRDRNA2_/TRDRNA2_157584_c0_seq1.p1  ORF type:complete len:272 (+),score=52.93 gnl/TRDRNA2_/TRDRNA2_157584_c0_seq1:53-868(+)